MNSLHVLDALTNNDLNLDIELGTFAKNIKKEVCGGHSKLFLSFKT
jgi:hypothetical protein